MIEIAELKVDQRPILFLGSFMPNWRSNRTSLLLCLLQKNRKCTNYSALQLVLYVHFPWYLWCIIHILLHVSSTASIISIRIDWNICNTFQKIVKYQISFIYFESNIHETIGNLSYFTPLTKSISTPLGSSEYCPLNWFAANLWNCISRVAFRMVFWCRTNTTINAIVDTTARPTPKVIASLNALLTKKLSDLNWNLDIHTVI